MRVKMFFAVILVSGLMLNTGCQKVKSLLDVKFNANYAVDLNISVPSTGSVKELKTNYSGSVDINPTANSEVSKYLHLIKAWHVEEITGTFKNVSKVVTLKSATLSITSDAGNTSWSFSNIQIKNGGSIILDNNNHQLDTLDKILIAKKPFKVSFSVDAGQGGFSFTLGVAIKTQITANPLASK